MIRTISFVLCAVLVVFSTSAQAQNSSWNVVSGNFSDPLNWNPQTFPTGNAIITNGGEALLGATAPPSSSISLLAIGGDATNNNDTGLSGTLTQSGQTLTVTGELRVGNNGGSGTLNMSGGTLNSRSWFAIGRWYQSPYDASVPGTTGVVNMTGGTINHSGSDFDIGERGTGTQGTLNMSGTAVFNTTGSATMIGAGDYGGAMGNGLGIFNISDSAQYNHSSGGLFNVGFNGSEGRLNINGGTINITNGGMDIGNGAVGTVNLNTGGVLKANAVTIAPNTGTGTLNFNGGTFKPTTSSTTFMRAGTGTAHAYVLEGGAVIDTQGFNITFGSILEHGGSAATDGGLFKTGAGTLTLGGGNSNTYNGPTTVNQGVLLVNYGLDSSTTVTVKSGATLGGNPLVDLGPVVVQSSGIIAPGDSTVNSGIGTLYGSTLNLSNSQLNFDIASSKDNINLTGNLTAAGTNTFNLSSSNPSSLSAGAFPLINFGSLTGGLGNFALTPGTLGSYATSLQINGNELDLVLTLISIEWTGATSANWSVATNWNPNSTPGGPGAIAKFAYAADGGTVTLDISPTVGTLIFDNIADSYTLNPSTGKVLTLDTTSGNAVIEVAGGTHTIAAPVTLKKNVTVSVDNASDSLTVSNVISQNGGTYGLTKQGSGTLYLNSTNSYSGATIINGGTLVANTIAPGGSSSSIGASLADSANLVFNTAALRYTGLTVLTDRGFTMNGDTSIEVTSSSSTLTFSGSILVAGSTAAHLTKTGSGVLKFINTGTNALATGNADVACDVQNGGLVIDGVGSTYAINNGSLHVGGVAGGNTSFTLANGSLSVGGDFIVADAAGPAGSASISGTMNISGNILMGDGTGATATATIGPGANINIGGEGRIANNGGNATLNMTGGTLTLNSWFAVSRHWDLTQPTGTIGVFNFSGGTINDIAPNNWNTVNICERGSGNQGTLNMSGTAVFNVNVADFRIGAGDGNQGGGQGILTIADTAQLNMLQSNTFNVGDTGSNGSLTMNGGTITLANGQFFVGAGNSGSTYSQGTLTINAGALNVNNWLCIGRSGGTGTGTMTGGTINKTGTGQSIVLGSLGGSGSWSQNGGTIFNASALILGEYATGLPSSGTFYLNGGLVQATVVQAGTTTNPGAAAGNFYFNGGTLQATAASTDYMAAVGGAALNVWVKANGAKIDTQNFNVTINQILAVDPSSTGGGLTKLGSGTLTITQNATYTGNTTVSAGILDMLNINTPSATVTVAGGGNELTASSIVANTLTIGAGSSVVIKALPGGPTAALSLSPVPEPSMLALLASAALATLLTAWRKRRSN